MYRGVLGNPTSIQRWDANVVNWKDGSFIILCFCDLTWENYLVIFKFSVEGKEPIEMGPYNFNICLFKRIYIDVF